jgi:hypothetical protein
MIDPTNEPKKDTVNITLNPKTWLFEEGEISKFSFGNNFDHAVRFIQAANISIEEERKYLSKDRCCISCCCLCICLTCIFSPCFFCWAVNFSKEVLKNVESIKSKMRALINTHRPEFNSNGCDVVFREEVRYTRENPRKVKQVTVYFFEFTLIHTMNFPQISNNQTNNYPGIIDNHGYENNNVHSNVYHINNRNENHGGLKNNNVTNNQGNVYFNPNIQQSGTNEFGPVDNHNVYVNPNNGENENFNVNPNPNNDPSIKPIIYETLNTNKNNDNFEYDQTSGPMIENKPDVNYD